MSLVPLSNLFDVKYGVNLELNRLTHDPKGVVFIGRSAKNNGITGRVQTIPDVSPIAAGAITVAGGGSVLESFVQMEPFYSGRDLYYLTPKVPMTLNQKLYYCLCIRANKYRYNYGRQANRTLKDIAVPDISDIPDWTKDANPSMFDGAGASALVPTKFADLSINTWGVFKYKELFFIERGRGPRKKDLNGQGAYPFVSASEFNNGITDYSDLKPFHKDGVITVARNGNSVASAFYQDVAFHSTEDVHVFTPKFEMTRYAALFICTLIRQERYRYSYGRKWGIARMNETDIRLPVKADRTPDVDFMEQYIKSLPYSSKVQ
jgi:hypothetical protein